MKETFDKNDWYVAPASLKEAQELVRQFHYSKGGSNTAVYVHGLYERGTDRLCGVAWWLPPTRVACESHCIIFPDSCFKKVAISIGKI